MKTPSEEFWWENSGKEVSEIEFADHVNQVLKNIGNDESYEHWLKTQITSSHDLE